MDTNILHTRGDTLIRTMAFTDSNGQAINLTGSTITFTVKVKCDDEEPVISQEAVLTNPSQGQAKITVDSTDMEIDIGNYYYDIQWEDSIGVIITVVKGTLSISYDVTN